MENRVGDNVPPQQTIDEIKKSVEGAVATLAKFCIVLLPSERKQALRGRIGADIHIELVARLAAKYGVTVPGAPADGMMNDLLLTQKLAPLVALLQNALQLVEDTELEATSESWQAFLTLYAALELASRHNGALAKELAGTVEFMKAGVRRRKKNQKLVDAGKAMAEANATTDATADATA